jgi:AcrR family transcriptional regulator
MPRFRVDASTKRLSDLAEAALTVFSTHGFERSQMADVAKAMGVAVGTVYLYVESKDALFDLLIRYTSHDTTDWLQDLELPVSTPAPGATIAFLRDLFGRRGQWPLLERALSRPRADDPRTELAGVIHEQYALMVKHRRGLVLLTRSALEYPGLLESFVFGLRSSLLAFLEQYIQSRVQAGQFHPHVQAFAVAAVITQTIAWANLQRPFDPGLATVSEEIMAQVTVDMLVRSLLMHP